MRGRGEVGEAEAGAGDPAAVVEQIVHIVEVAVGDPHRLAQHPRIGRIRG